MLENTLDENTENDLHRWEDEGGPTPKLYTPQEEQKQTEEKKKEKPVTDYLMKMFLRQQ